MAALNGRNKPAFGSPYLTVGIILEARPGRIVIVRLEPATQGSATSDALSDRLPLAKTSYQLSSRHNAMTLMTGWS